MARSDVSASLDRGENQRRNLREFAEGAVRLLSKPTKAWLSVTGKCNLLCTHCPRSLVDEQFLSSDEMQPPVFKRVKEEVFPALDLLRIGGNNLGEQLFARSWNTYAGDISGQPFTPWLITNAQAMNLSRVIDLVKAGYIIDISIDAATEETYRQIRGASLAKLVENVRAIVRERDAQARETRRSPAAKVLFSFTAFADNIDELPALVQLAGELGVDEVVVTHYMPSLEAQRFQSLFYHQHAANRAFAAAAQVARGNGVALQVPPQYQVPPLGGTEALRVSVKNRYGPEMPSPKATASELKCAHPWTSVSINEKGEVYPCCQSNLLMGDLSKSSFEEIWNNRRYQQLRQSVNSDHPMPDCRRCVLRGSTFTSVACSEGSFFLRNLDLPGSPITGPLLARAREWCARTNLGKRLWRAARSAYKNFFEWRLATR